MTGRDNSPHNNLSVPGSTGRSEESTMEPVHGASMEEASGVPLSVVIGIGGSLLMINILIFAGLCYQRERIRKMRDFNAEADLNMEETIRLQNKFDPSGSSRGADGEGASLLSGHGSPRQHKHNGRPSSPGKHEISHIHNPSPQPSNHSSSRLDKSLSRDLHTPESLNCSYAPVPNQILSPIHRPQDSHSQDSGNYVNSQVGQVARGHPAMRGSDMSGEGSLVKGKAVAMPQVPTLEPHYDRGHASPLSHSSLGHRPDTRPDIRQDMRPENRPDLRQELRQDNRSDIRHDGRPDNRPDDPVYKTINKAGVTNAVTIV